MIYVMYVVIAVGVIFLSNKASKYVDLLDKTTTLSGAFIGGIMLSAVTSLPELFTSISSTLLVGKPELCMGNILGSNIFNVAVLALLIILNWKAFSAAKIAKSHVTVTLSLMLIYVAILLNKYGVLSFEILTISFTSLMIGVLYFISLKHLSAENGGEVEEEVSCELTKKQIITRLFVASIGIIGLSIAITFVTDQIAINLNLGNGLAGAIFLGVATSLPEVTATISLFKMKNYNIAIVNIIRSNLFNFLVLASTDVIEIGKGLYSFEDPKTLSWLVFGAIATPLLLVFFRQKEAKRQVLFPYAIIACYLAFLFL